MYRRGAVLVVIEGGTPNVLLEIRIRSGGCTSRNEGDPPLSATPQLFSKFYKFQNFSFLDFWENIYFYYESFVLSWGAKRRSYVVSLLGRKNISSSFMLGSVSPGIDPFPLTRRSGGSLLSDSLACTLISKAFRFIKYLCREPHL